MSDQPVVTTFLEMRERPKAIAARPSRSGMLLHLDAPTPRFYRYLYESVGGRWQWSSRLTLGDEELGEVISDPGVEVFVLFLGGEPAGFFELDARRPGEVEVVHFGLVPEYVGRGLGAYLLSAAVDAAWDLDPDRVWARLDTLAHPRALLVYQRAGFTVYDTRPGRAEETGDGT